jgi:hypothetical protein
MAFALLVGDNLPLEIVDYFILILELSSPSSFAESSTLVDCHQSCA